MRITNSTNMDKSDIIPIREQKSDYADFPFEQTGEGIFVQAYKNSEVKPGSVREKFSPKKQQYEIYSDTSSKYPHLAQKFKNAETDEKEKINNQTSQFLEYVSNEDFKQNVQQVQEHLG